MNNWTGNLFYFCRGKNNKPRIVIGAKRDWVNTGLYTLLMVVVYGVLYSWLTATYYDYIVGLIGSVIYICHFFSFLFCVFSNPGVMVRLPSDEEEDQYQSQLHTGGDDL